MKIDKTTTRAITWGLVALALGGGAYFGFIHKGKDGKTYFKRLQQGREMTREDAIAIIKKHIESKGGTMIADASKIETGYLVERAKAIKDGRERFFYKERYYSVTTGKVV